MNAEIHTLTGAYALDALSGTERAGFEHHLAECPACAAEVAELQATAAALGTAVAATPPPGLRAKVLAEARRTRQLPPAAPRVVAPPPGRWRARLLVAAAAACLVVAAVFGVQSVSAQREAAQAQQQLDQVLTVLSAPDARIATASAGDSVATAVVSPSTGRLAFLARNMPALDEDRSYQIWATGPNGRHSIGTLGAGQDPPPVIGALGGATDVAVTIEPRGGSPAPTTPTIMEFELPTT